MSIRTLSNQKVDLQAESLTATGSGDYSVAWVPLVRRMRGRLNELSARDIAEFKKIDRSATHVYYCKTKVGTALNSTSRTVPDLIRENKTARVVFTQGQTTRRFLVVGVRDFDAQKRLTVLALEERENAYWND